jgi:hypothetical protein
LPRPSNIYPLECLSHIRRKWLKILTDFAH